MDYILAMLRCYGDRFIFCDDDRAEFDLKENRDDMIKAFAAIMNYVSLKINNKT